MQRLLGELIATLGSEAADYRLECWEDAPGSCSVRIRARGDEWIASFDLRRFDFFSVVAVLNEALAGSPSAHRFCWLRTDDQSVRFALARLGEMKWEKAGMEEYGRGA